MGHRIVTTPFAPAAACLADGCDWSAPAGSRLAGTAEQVARQHCAEFGHTVQVVFASTITRLEGIEAAP